MTTLITSKPIYGDRFVCGIRTISWFIISNHANRSFLFKTIGITWTANGMISHSPIHRIPKWLVFTRSLHTRCLEPSHSLVAFSTHQKSICYYILHRIVRNVFVLKSFFNYSRLAFYKPIPGLQWHIKIAKQLKFHWYWRRLVFCSFWIEKQCFIL